MPVDTRAKRYFWYMSDLLLFLSVSLPTWIKENGWEVLQMYLILCGMLFNFLCLVIIVWA